MPHSIESIASTRKKTKENLRVESLFPLELREKAAPLIDLLESYYGHINERGQASYILNSINNQRDIDFAELIVGNIESIEIANPGSGYSDSPTVTIIGDGIGAAAKARVDQDGRIYAIDLLPGKKGWGYTNATVTISDATGINAVAVATISDNSYLDLLQKEIAPVIPKIITADRVSLYKNLMKYYSVRGSTESIELFFKILYDDSAEIYYPKNDLLIPSSGKWLSNLSVPTYTASPIIMVKGNGSGARASATVKNGIISSLVIDNHGDNYQNISLDINGDGVGATAVANTDYGKITNLQITNAGTGYDDPQTNTIVQISDGSGGSGEGATAEVKTDRGQITDISVVRAGSGYITANVLISGDGEGAKAVATLSTGGGINTIEIIDPGYGYTTATATIVGYTNRESLNVASYTSTGSTTIVASIPSTLGISAGDYITIKNAFDGQYEKLNGSWQITGVNTAVTFQESANTVTKTSHGYQNNDLIFFSSITTTTGITTGKLYYVANAATDTFQLSLVKNATGNSNLIVDLVNNGTGNISNLRFTISSAMTAGVYTDTRIGKAEYGSDAVLSAAIGAGAITDITITNQGQNYSNPIVSIIGSGINADITPTIGTGKIVSALITNPGYNYTNATVSITGDGTNGALSTNIVNGGIVALTPIEVGADYSNASVEIYGEGTGAKAIPVIENGEIVSYTVTSFGSGYPIPGVFTGYQLGTYNENKGFLSDVIKLQDSYFYQSYSYVIRTGSNVENWKDAFNKLVHPAGFIFFGQILVLIELLKKYAAMPKDQPGLISDEDIPLLILLYAFKIFKDSSSVTLQGSTDTVTKENHGYPDGMRVVFTDLSASIGISTYYPYYVVSATDNTFKLSETKGGSAILLTGDATGTVSRYSDRIKTAVFTGQIDNTFDTNDIGNVLTVTSISSGIIKIGMVLTGNGIIDGTYVSEFITGTGGIGKYRISTIQNTPSTTIRAISSDSCEPLVKDVPKTIALNVTSAITSTTSLSYSLGTKTLTVQTGLSLASSQSVILYSPNNLYYFMSGTVTSYNPLNGELIVDITNKVGTDTYTSWIIIANCDHMLKFYDGSVMEIYRNMTIEEADSGKYSYDDYTIQDVINNTIVWNDVNLGVNFT